MLQNVGNLLPNYTVSKLLKMFILISTAVVRIKNANCSNVNISPSIPIGVLRIVLMVHLLASGILKRAHLHFACAEYR